MKSKLKSVMILAIYNSPKTFMTPCEPGYPKEYTIPCTTSSSRVVGVYIRAGIPESPHSHNGGILVHCASPIKVFSYPDKKLIYESEATGDSLSAAFHAVRVDLLKPLTGGVCADPGRGW